MINKIESPNFLGVCGSSTDGHLVEQYQNRLEVSGASVLRQAGSASLVAAWGDENLYHDIDADGVAIAVLGHPRWRDGEPQPGQGDSECGRSIVERYKQVGPSVLDFLIGDFALSIVDCNSRKVLLAVDRVGIGTVYYGHLGNALAFATDLDLLRSFSDVDQSINLQSIYDYTYYHAVPSPLTIYSGISKLPPAHKLQRKDDIELLERYWLPGFAASNTARESDLESELFAVLRRSVSRCSSGTAVGGFLSGGLDSSTVCGMLRESVGRSVPAVSVGFDEEGYDETEFARVAADHFDLQHIVHYMTPDEICDSVSLIARGYAEPFGNSSVVPSYICARTAKENGISTLLAGDGGDELFAGNTRYAKQKLFEYYLRIPGFLRSAITDPLFNGKPRSWQVGPLRKVGRYVSQANVLLPGRLQTFNLLEMRPDNEIFGSGFLAEIDAEHPRQLLQDEYGAADVDPVNRMLLSDWRFTLADNDLRKVVRTCQLAGVEVRFPLLDDEVIDFSARVPAALKLKGLKLRHFYRQALRDYLPQEVLNKSKHGFGLPFGEWLNGSDRLREMVHDALSDLRKRGIFLDSFVDSLLQDHRQQHAAFYGNMVWVLAMLEWWLANHNPEFRV